MYLFPQSDKRGLIEKFDTNDEWEREETIKKLRKIGKDAIPDLLKAALKDESLLVRNGALHVLKGTSEVVPDELITALKSGDLKVRRRAVILLSESGAGKTSLAFQIGRLVMLENSQERPSKHLMLPVLLEEELRGFLLALRDCYLAKGKKANLPQTVAKELENLPVLSHRQ